MTDPSRLPLSRSVAVHEIPAAGLLLRVEADPAERAAIAAFNGLPVVASLVADLRLHHEGTVGVHVTGRLLATVTQTCVVSLEPFEASVDEPLDVHFLTPEALTAWQAERAGQADPDDEPVEDEPDAIEQGRIDVGLLVAEHLTLGLDPYPRKPGAALAPEATPPDVTESPFAVLRRLTEDKP